MSSSRPPARPLPHPRPARDPTAYQPVPRSPPSGLARANEQGEARRQCALKRKPAKNPDRTTTDLTARRPARSRCADRRQTVLERPVRRPTHRAASLADDHICRSMDGRGQTLRRGPRSTAPFAAKSVPVPEAKMRETAAAFSAGDGRGVVGLRQEARHSRRVKRPLGDVAYPARRARRSKHRSPSRMNRSMGPLLVVLGLVVVAAVFGISLFFDDDGATHPNQGAQNTAAPPRRRVRPRIRPNTRRRNPRAPRRKPPRGPTP